MNNSNKHSQYKDIIQDDKVTKSESLYCQYFISVGYISTVKP